MNQSSQMAKDFPLTNVKVAKNSFSFKTLDRVKEHTLQSV